MTLPPDVLVRIFGVLLGALCIVVGSLAVWLGKRAITWIRAWVIFDIEKQKAMSELQAAIARVEKLELELRGDGTEDHPGVIGRIDIVENFARDGVERTARLEKDLGLSEPSMRELRVRRMQEKLGLAARRAFVENIPDPAPVRHDEREVLPPRYEEPRQLERFRDARRAEERQSSHPPLSDLPPPALKTLPRSRHETPFTTRHSTTQQPAVKRKPGEEPPDDSSGEE